MKEQLAQELALLEGKRQVIRKELKELDENIAAVKERYLVAKFPDLQPGVLFTTQRSRWGSHHYTFDGFGRSYDDGGKPHPVICARVWTARVRNDSVEAGVATKGRAVKIPYEEAINLRVVK